MSEEINMSHYEVDKELKNILLADWQFKALNFQKLEKFLI